MNAEAVETTIAALNLLPEHEALAQAARGLAAAVDAQPANAALWHEYRDSVKALRAVAPQVNEDDGTAKLISLVRPPIPYGPDPSKKNARPRNRAGGRKARQSADAVATPSRGRSRRAAT